ncbi:MAG: glycoside hydrolase family 9 protein [Uliginosibacterium sp.]|nr:glycoside hydrolase family 9 protein [Uliginosibacterium sp.]
MPAIDVSGGWYDAGDYGKYVVNGATSLWALQNVIEYHQSKGTLDAVSRRFPQGEPGGLAGIDGQSDLLEEAKHEMKWLLKMQIQQDLTVRVPTKNYDVAGSAIADTPDRINLALPDDTPATDGSGTWGTRYYLPKRVKIQLGFDEINAKHMVFSAVRDAAWTGILCNRRLHQRQAAY